MQRAARHDPRPLAGQAAAPPAERGVIGNGEIEPEQPQHAADEALGLAQGQMEDEPQHQHELDRQIRIAPLPARRGSPGRLPSGDRGIVQPQREVATTLQPTLVGRPVLDAVPSPRNAVATSAVGLERQGFSSRVGGAASRRPSPPLSQPRCTNACCRPKASPAGFAHIGLRSSKRVKPTISDAPRPAEVAPSVRRTNVRQPLPVVRWPKRRRA